MVLLDELELPNLLPTTSSTSSSGGGDGSSGGGRRRWKKKKRKRKDGEHSNEYLCEFLMDHLDHLDKLDKRNNNGNTINNTVESSSTTVPVLRYDDVDCGYQYGTHRLGNFLLRWYLTRLIVQRAGMVHLAGSCRKNDVYRWLQQTQKTQKTMTGRENRSTSWYETCQLCLSNVTKVRDMCVFPQNNDDERIALADAVHWIVQDMEALRVGVVKSTSTSPVTTNNNKKKRNRDIVYDDIVIHLRLNDVGKIPTSKYGLLPFHTYTKYILPSIPSSSSWTNTTNTTFTIGIVTAPFQLNRGKHRPNDPSFNEAVAGGLQQYLQQIFPSAIVSIRNDRHETHDIVFARLLQATVLICSPSTYCLVPALGRYDSSIIGGGTKYDDKRRQRQRRRTIVIQTPLFGPIPGWLGRLADDDNNNNNNNDNSSSSSLSSLTSLSSSFEYVDEPFITSTALSQMTLSQVMTTLQQQ